MTLKTIAKVMIFLLLGLFLGSQLWWGTLNFYIHPRFNMLIGLAAVGLVITGLVYAYQHRHALLTSEPDHDHEHEHAHSHDLSWLALAILALPLILGVAVRPKPLGAAALQNREINAGSLSSLQAPSGSQLAIMPTAGERNILDWLYLFQSSEDPADFAGEPVHVIGFVYQDDRFSETQFMVSRFTVSCCAADAVPVGLVVQWPDTAQLPPDTWVEVTGTLQTGEFNGQTMPILQAEEVSETEQPAQPYLYQ
jgi:uncharacterized repeat protein (TIGR03943 family)